MKTHRALLISDFNLANFAAVIANDPEEPVIEPSEAPFGQVISCLLDGSAPCWSDKLDLAIVWTQPQSVIKSFNDLLQGIDVPLETLHSEVDEFIDALRKGSARVAALFVPTWSLPGSPAIEGLLAMKEQGIRHALLQMNARLIAAQQQSTSLHVLDSEGWIRAAGKYAFSPKLWYMAKVPFGNEVFQEAAKDIKSALNGLHGNARKLIVVDLDNTLWGGIVGDVGWEHITLGGHDPIGEAFLDFQRGLGLLKRRGVLLAIVSKNEEATALEAIDKHPEMILRRTDFVSWRINWADKAQNLADLVDELNLGLQSVVFLDDNPAERARIRETFSEVLVPELPEDKMLYRSVLMGLRCFNFPSISKEDLGRSDMYRAERERTSLRDAVSSVDEWLTSLNITVIAERLNAANLARTAQLLNKTNQMNLSTRRLTEQELSSWAGQDKHLLLTFRVGDRFGDAGLTGIAGMEWIGSEGRITDFVLSCRVIGRKIEEAMIHVLLTHARQMGLKTLLAEYLPTPKNAPCLHFLESSGYSNRNGNSFVWVVADAYPLSKCITLQEAEGTVAG